MKNAVCRYTCSSELKLLNIPFSINSTMVSVKSIWVSLTGALVASVALNELKLALVRSLTKGNSCN